MIGEQNAVEVGQPRIWGNPVHGLVKANVLTRADGSTLALGFTPANGDTRMTRPAGWTAPVRTPDELALDAAAHHEWQGYLLQSGPQGIHRFALGNYTGLFGAGGQWEGGTNRHSWLLAAAPGLAFECCAVADTFNAPAQTFRLKVGWKRFGVVAPQAAPPAAPLQQVTINGVSTGMALGTTIADVLVDSASPDGRDVILVVTSSTPGNRERYDARTFLRLQASGTPNEAGTGLSWSVSYYGSGDTSASNLVTLDTRQWRTVLANVVDDIQPTQRVVSKTWAAESNGDSINGLYQTGEHETQAIESKRIAVWHDAAGQLVDIVVREVETTHDTHSGGISAAGSWSYTLNNGGTVIASTGTATLDWHHDVARTRTNAVQFLINGTIAAQHVDTGDLTTRVTEMTRSETPWPIGTSAGVVDVQVSESGYSRNPAGTPALTHFMDWTPGVWRKANNLAVLISGAGKPMLAGSPAGATTALPATVNFASWHPGKNLYAFDTTGPICWI